MASPPSSAEAYWASVLLSLTVATILVVNVLLLQVAKPRGGLLSRKGRFVRPLLRKVTGRARTRSRSTSMGGLPPQVNAEQQPQDVDNLAPPSVSGVWEAAARWVRWDPNASTRSAVQSWIENGDEDSARS